MYTVRGEHKGCRRHSQAAIVMWPGPFPLLPHVSAPPSTPQPVSILGQNSTSIPWRWNQLPTQPALAGEPEGDGALLTQTDGQFSRSLQMAEVLGSTGPGQLWLCFARLLVCLFSVCCNLNASYVVYFIGFSMEDC